MALIENSKMIEYLSSRKFKPYKEPPPPLEGGLRRVYPYNYKLHEDYITKIHDYQKELSQLKYEELSKLYEQEQAREREQILIMLDEQEKARFYNQANADADYAHWSRAMHWTLDEAIALSFGKAPEVVNWVEVKPHIKVSKFAKEYGKRRDLALRALSWKKLFDPMLPTIFISWAKELDISLPPELISNVEKRLGIAVNWYEEYRKIKVAYDELQKETISTKEVAEKPLSDRERNSLYRIIAALSETLLNVNSDDMNKPSIRNQASLITHLDSQYDGYEGVSKSNLEKVLPAAKKLLIP